MQAKVVDRIGMEVGTRREARLETTRRLAILHTLIVRRIARLEGGTHAVSR